MTRIRFLTSIAGMGFAFQAGDVADWPDAEAARLIAAGIAEKAPADKPTREKR